MEECFFAVLCVLPVFAVANIRGGGGGGGSQSKIVSLLFCVLPVFAVVNIRGGKSVEDCFFAVLCVCYLSLLWPTSAVEDCFFAVSLHVTCLCCGQHPRGEVSQRLFLWCFVWLPVCAVANIHGGKSVEECFFAVLCVLPVFTVAIIRGGKSVEDCFFAVLCVCYLSLLWPTSTVEDCFFAVLCVCLPVCCGQHPRWEVSRRLFLCMLPVFAVTNIRGGKSVEDCFFACYLSLLWPTSAVGSQSKIVSLHVTCLCCDQHPRWEVSRRLFLCMLPVFAVTNIHGGKSVADYFFALLCVFTVFAVVNIRGGGLFLCCFVCVTWLCCGQHPQWEVSWRLFLCMLLVLAMTNIRGGLFLFCVFTVFAVLCSCHCLITACLPTVFAVLCNCQLSYNFMFTNCLCCFV